MRLGGEFSSSTGNRVPQIFSGDFKPLSFPPQWYIDVRDATNLDVAALVDPSAVNQRLDTFAEPGSGDRVLEILRNLSPENESPADKRIMPNQDAEALLQKHCSHSWTPVKDSIEGNPKRMS